MIEVVIDDKVINVGEELTIGQYQKFQANKEIYQKDKAQLLSLYLGINPYQLKDMPYEQVKFVEEYITDTLLNEDYKDETYDRFEFEGVEYGLENDWSKLAWGAWVDLEVFGSDKVDENIHKIMAVLYRPVIKTTKKGYSIAPYKASEIDERAELFQKLPIKYWFGAASLFFLLASISTSNTVNSLNMKIKLNKLIMIVWNKLPRWIKLRLPLDSILF